MHKLFCKMVTWTYWPGWVWPHMAEEHSIIPFSIVNFVWNHLWDTPLSISFRAQRRLKLLRRPTLIVGETILVLGCETEQKGKEGNQRHAGILLPLLPGLLIGTPTCLPRRHGHYALKPWVQRKPFFLSCFLVKYLLTTIRGVTNTRAYDRSFILGGKECFHHQEGNMVTRTSSHPATCPGKGSRLFATHARRVLTKATEGHLVTVESKP